MSTKHGKRAVGLGKDMWLMLCKTFMDVAIENGFDDPEQRAAMWAGFIAACCGSMTSDLGNTSAQAIMSVVQTECGNVARSETGVTKS